MAEPIRISRQGLTRCSSCHTHIKMAASVKETECPFCGAPLWSADAPAKPAQLRLGGKGRALLAATVLGSSLAFAACGGNGGKTETPTENAADAGLPAPAYGIAPQPDAGTPETAPAPDATDKPLYGQPAPD